MSKEIGGETLEVRRYSEALKQAVVSELDEGLINMSEALEHYGLKCRRTVNRWRQVYGKTARATKIVRIVMKDEQKRIRELEKALADAKIKNALLEGAVKYLSENVSEKVKKKLSIKPFSESGKEVDIALANSAKLKG